MTSLNRVDVAMNVFRWVLVLPSAFVGWLLGQTLFLVIVFATDNYQKYGSFLYQLPFRTAVDFISGAAAIVAVFLVTPEGWKTRACAVVTVLFVAFGILSLTKHAAYHTGILGVAGLVAGAVSATIAGAPVERRICETEA